jgi:hypothetical protein
VSRPGRLAAARRLSLVSSTPTDGSTAASSPATSLINAVSPQAHPTPSGGRLGLHLSEDVQLQLITQPTPCPGWTVQRPDLAGLRASRDHLEEHRDRRAEMPHYQRLRNELASTWRMPSALGRSRPRVPFVLGSGAGAAGDHEGDEQQEHDGASGRDPPQGRCVPGRAGLVGRAGTAGGCRRGLALR